MSDIETGATGPDEAAETGADEAQEAADRMGQDDADESGAGYGNHATGYEDDATGGTESDQR